MNLFRPSSGGGRGTRGAAVVALALLAAAAVVSSCLVDPVVRFTTSWASVDSVSVVTVTADAADLTIHGSKPTPCHEIPDPTPGIEAAAASVKIRMTSRTESSVACAQVIAPYAKDVRVEGLSVGRWTVNVEGGNDSVRVEIDVPGRP